MLAILVTNTTGAGLPNAAFSTPSGYTSLYTENDTTAHVGSQHAYLETTAAGAQIATWTWSSGAQTTWHAAIAAFKLTSGAGAAVGPEVQPTRDRLRTRPGRTPYTYGRLFRPKTDVYAAPKVAVAATAADGVTSADASTSLLTSPRSAADAAAATDTGAAQLIDASAATDAATAGDSAASAVPAASATATDAATAADAGTAQAALGAAAADTAAAADSADEVAVLLAGAADAVTAGDGADAVLLSASDVDQWDDRLGSQRPRPGRGPYSLGRLFRPRIDVLRLAVDSALAAMAADAAAASDQAASLATLLAAARRCSGRCGRLHPPGSAFPPPQPMRWRRPMRPAAPSKAPAIAAPPTRWPQATPRWCRALVFNVSASDGLRWAMPRHAWR